MSDIFDNSDAMNDEGPFAPLDAYGGLALQRRQRAIRLPARRQPASPLGSPVVEQRPLAAGPAPARQPLGEAPPYGPLTQEQAQDPRSQPLQQLRYELEHPVTVNQPHGLKAFGEGLLSVLFPRAEQFIQQRRYAPMLGQQQREANLQKEVQLLGGQEQPQEWTPISGTNMEVNRRTGETKQLHGVTMPSQDPKRANTVAFGPDKTPIGIYDQQGNFVAPDAQGKFPGTISPALAAEYQANVQHAREPKDTAQEDFERYTGILQKRTLKQPVSREDDAWAHAYEMGKTLGPRTTFNLQASGATSGLGGGLEGKTGQELLAALPGPTAAIVKGLAEGRLALPSSFALRMPYWQRMMGLLTQYDPTFNQQRYDLRRGYTVGKQSAEINAINTALGHIGVLGDSINALQNGDIRVLNAMANRLGLETGSTPITVFKTIVNRVGPEVVRAYVGAGAGEAEREITKSDFSPGLSPQQLLQNVSITARLLQSKISSLANQWNQNKGPGMPDFEAQFIMPQASQTLSKYAPAGRPSAAPWEKYK